MTAPTDNTDLPVAEDPPEEQVQGMATDDDLNPTAAADEETD
ncbi:hypothetical protein ABZX39_33410 [Streptomyces collinus]